MSETITIDRGEYDRLREAADELADLYAYDRAKADLASRTDELVPHAFARRILDGETPLRVFRELRGLSQVKLAALSGVNRVQIANIEAGRKSGSVETARKLADALGVLVDDLV